MESTVEELRTWMTAQMEVVLERAKKNGVPSSINICIIWPTGLAGFVTNVGVSDPPHLMRVGQEWVALAVEMKGAQDEVPDKSRLN